MKNTFKRSLTFILAVIMVFSCFFACPVTFSVSASDAAFEKEIASFPESYKPYLRTLHEKYPNWKFEMLNTGLEWADAIAAESSKNRNLVPKTASDLLKSKASGDYNADTDTYIEKDAGWVCANSIAVSYFMDPRNFLNETNVFQFELLSFSEAITVATVEQVLDGTFMHDSKITYYDSNGNKKSSSKKYAEVIYNAGKTYDINPCYLASKIRNEVVVSGGSGSGSVTGKYSGYEGIYNFYNIGAYDGATPIKNGLKWASDNSTGSYSRPWTTPEKSIMGGAQYLAEKYIARGQDTGYLQKFDVSPASGNSIYTHQYMTNVSGADSQGYTTYQSYKKLNLLEIDRVFSIPVYNNMPGTTQQSGAFTLLDSQGNVGKITASTLNLRSIASTSGSVVAKISSGTTVKILSKGKVASDYYNTYLNNPFWYQISVVIDNKTYTGYVSADYVNVSTVVNIKRGTTFTLPNNITTAEQPTYYTSNSSVVSVNADGTLSALKNGSAEITATTSNGGYDFIKVKVSDTDVSNLTVNNFSVSGTDGTAAFSWSAVDGANGYDILVYQGNDLLATTTVGTGVTSAEIANLPVSESLISKIRAYTQTNTSRVNGEFSIVGDFTVNPQQVKNVRCVEATKSSFALDWDDVSDVSGYEIHKYDDTLKAYKLIRTVTDSYYKFSSVKSGFSSKYMIRAFKTAGGQNYYGNFSAETTGYTYHKNLGTITQGTTDKTSVKLSWNKVDNATKYEIYKYDVASGKLTKLDSITKTNYTAKKLTANTSYVFTVVAYAKVDGKSVKYAGRDIQVSTASYAPKNLKVTGITGKTYTLTWDSVKNAVKYRVYKYDTAAKKYKLLDTVSTNSITIETTPLTSDMYKVKAGVKSGSKTVYSAYSASVTAKSAPAKVTGLSYKNVTESSYTLTWNKVSGDIDGYYIYKYDSGTKKYKYYKSTKKTSYTIKKLKAGETAYYIVKAYYKDGSQKIKGDDSKKLKVKTLPAQVTGLAISNQTTESYTLSWNAVNGAKGYEIYEYNSAKKKYVKVAKTGKTSYNFKSQEPTSKTKYKVRAYLYIGSKKLNGEYSKAFTANTLPADTTKISTKKISSGKYKISWKEVEGAGWYRIYIYNAEKGKYKYIGKTEKCNYTISNLTKGKQKVKVVSCIKVNSKKYYSVGKVKSFTVK